MPNLREKKEILEKANYRYHFSRAIYFNRDDRKIFSLEAIEDHDPNWLIDRINAVPKSEKWSFFFNAEPPEKIRNEILQELGG